MTERAEPFDARLIVSGLTKRFERTVALDDVSFSIGSGAITGLLGPNGAGKTTLMSIVVGLFPPTAGTIALGGEEFELVPAKAKHLFGFVPDSQDVLGSLTGWEYLNFLAQVYNLAGDDWRRVQEYVNLFDIDPKMDELLETYSHGQRKKIQIVAALMHRPPLLIMDEPLAGLDPEMVVIVKSLLRKLRSHGVAILLSTHDLGDAESICDQVVLLNHGKVIASGGLGEVLEGFESSNLEAAFLKGIGVADRAEELEHVLAGY